MVGVYHWGGNILGSLTTTLNGALLNDANGTGGSGTSITLTSTTGFPSSGTNYIQVDSEEISYTGITGNNLTGITRAARGSTRACLLYTSPSPRDGLLSRMPSSA